MCSSGTRSPPAEKDDEIPENVGDDADVRPFGDEEESLERNFTEENGSDDEADASAVNPVAPTAQTNALANTEDEQIAREAELFSQIHFLEQSVQKVEEELENQKKLNAQLEEQIKRLTESRDP